MTIIDAVARITPDWKSFEKDLASGSEKSFRRAEPGLKKGSKKAMGKAGREGSKEFVDETGKGVKKLSATNSKFSRHTVQAGQDAGKKSGKSFSTAFSKNAGAKMGDLGKKMTAGVTLPLVALGGLAVNTASNVNEAVSATGFVFGDSSQEIVDWSSAMVDSMGSAQSETLEFSNAMGSMLTGLGLSEQQAAEMVQPLIERANDVGSLRNMSASSVMQAFMSGLSGESEPLKKFGVNIQAVAIEARALEMGLLDVNVVAEQVAAAEVKMGQASDEASKALREHGVNSNEYILAAERVYAAEQSLASATEGTASQLTAQQKALAISSLILDGTANANGNFAATMGETANQSKIARAELERVGAEFGEKLLPLVVEFLGHANKILDFFTSLPDGVQGAIVVVGALAAALGPLLIAMASLLKIGGGIAAAGGVSGMLGGTGASGLAGVGGAGLLGKGAVLAAAGIGGFKIGETVAKSTGLADMIAESGIGKAVFGAISGQPAPPSVPKRSAPAVQAQAAAANNSTTMNVSGVTVVANDPATFQREMEAMSRNGSAQYHRTRRPVS